MLVLASSFQYGLPYSDRIILKVPGSVYKNKMDTTAIWNNMEISKEYRLRTENALFVDLIGMWEESTIVSLFFTSTIFSDKIL